MTYKDSLFTRTEIKYGFVDRINRMGIDELREHLAFWQKTLRLMDWDINLIYSKTARHAGNSRKLSDYKAAEIMIADPETLSDTSLGNSDPEVTLVHELLHLQGEQLDDWLLTPEGKRYLNDNERLIELTSIALVTLRRNAKT